MRRILRRHVEQIFRAALARVHAGNAVRAALEGSTAEAIVVGGDVNDVVPITGAGVYALAIGKAAPAMLAAVEDLLGDALRDGIGVTKQFPAHAELRAKLLVGSHPVPDEASVRAGEAVLEFARTIPDGAVVLCLISGGGSALMELPRTGVTLDELQEITRRLLRAGASIHELNAVRSRLSQVKAGGLLAALRHTDVINLIVSDVLGSDVATIASGPTVPPTRDYDADAVLRKYQIGLELPELDAQMSTDALQRRRVTAVIADVRAAIEAAGVAARELGYTPLVLSRSIDGEAREVGQTIGQLARDSRSRTRPGGGSLCILAGGEMVVTVRGDGIGGRNSEAALAAATAVRGTTGVAVGFLATDGDDGLTGAAGAIIDGETVRPDMVAMAADAMERNDSFTFLSTRGAVLRTGPTETNVNDLVIGLVA